MEFNVSDTSLAFSDVVGPSHVSGLESFSDFEVGSEYESFEDQEAHDSGVEEESVTPQPVDSTQNINKDVKEESFSIGANRLPSGDIREFLNALESAKAQLGMAISSQELENPLDDESSLGILNLDSTHETSAFNSNHSSPDILSQLKSKLTDQNEFSQVHDERTLPYDSEFNSPITLGHLQQDISMPSVQEKSVNGNLDKSSTNRESNIKEGCPVSSLGGLRLSQSQDELGYMLQTTRSSSGDGGELIDRVSMSSSISFLQSQTFPESLFSSSYTRGSGSGTDSGPSDTNKDDQDDDHHSNADDINEDDGDDNDHTLSLIHDTGDGSNGQSSVGRPGLEGANSEPEDGFPSSGASTEVAASGSIELRQSGEGVDVPPDLPGDGGGGGDGSSGHESDDDDDDNDDNQPTGSSDNISSTRSSSRSSVSSLSDQYVPVAVPPPGSTGMIDIAEGRGPPVGHAGTDKTPPLIPSPQRLSGNFGSTSMNQFDVLAASTPMVRPGKNAFRFESGNTAEMSGISTQYLFATQGNANRPVIRVTENSFVQQQDGSFHLSQVLDGSRSKEENDMTLTDAPSLNFEAQGMTPRPQLHTDFDHDKTLTGMTPSRNDSQPRDISKGTTQQRNTEHSFGLYEEISTTDNSLLWKSTPRDVEEEAVRSTPGIVFGGKERPSPVLDDHDGLQIAVDSTSNSHIEQNCHGRSVQDESLKRLQTPGGSEEQTIPFSTWSQNSSHQHYNPFEDDGSLQQSVDFNNVQDDDFVSAGDAMAILAADEKSFEKEHQFDAPVNPEEVISSQDWTVASDRSAGRRSQVIGVNDPNNEGEMRISFGAFIACGSEELGSLTGSDPNRPRPHFGDGTITTPSPKAPFRLIAHDLTDNDIFDHHTSTADDFSLYQPSSSKQTNISDTKEPKTVKKAPKGHTSRKGSLDTTKKDGDIGTDTRKTLLDGAKSHRPDSGRERRGSQGSTHSSHSSGSKSSAPSVIRKDKKETKSKKEGKDESKARRHRTHREPDGCPSKENNGAQQPPQVSQSSSTANALKDKKNVIDSKASKVGGKKTQRKPVQRTKSEGQDSDGGVKSRQPSASQQSQSSTDETISSILSTGSISFKNQQELAKFIARAVNVSPEQIGHLLHAAADAKTKLHTTPDKLESTEKSEVVGTPPGELDATAQSPEFEKLQKMKPIASSSPHDTAAPVSTTVTTTSAGFTTPPNAASDILATSSYSIDNSVFVQDTQDNVSVIENTLSLTPPSKKVASPPPNPFTNTHIYPTFGKTYTVKGKKIQGEAVKPAQNVALDEKTLSTDFQPVNSVSICSAGSDLTLLESPEKYSAGKHDRSYDSAIHSKSPYTDTTGRHSWPKTLTESPQKQPVAPQGQYPVSARLQQPVHNTDYNRPITIGVPAQNIQNQAFPTISPQFPGQANAFSFQQGFGPPSAGLGSNSAPISGTFPVQYPTQTHNITPLGTLLGQVHNQLAQGQYPPNIFPHDGFSAPTYIGQGPLSVNQPQVVSTYGFYNQPSQAHTVSSGLGTRLATSTLPWQAPNMHLGEQPHHYATAPPMGLLQLGQPSMGSHGARSGSTDSQLPPGPQTRLANALTPIVIPGEVKLPPVCPVGVATRSILTLHNSSSKWIYCMVKVAYCSVNRAQVTSSVDNPFFVPSKLIINPHTTIPIEVIFKPNLAGLHTAQLHVTSTPAAADGQQTCESLPSLVALESVGEQPDIEILSEDSQVIDFGELVANSRHSRPLRLINKGKASIPIRLTITPNATSLHCFSFSNADASPKRGTSSSSATSKSFLSTHKLVLKGNQARSCPDEPQVTWIVFQAPQKHDSGNGSVGLPDEFTARVDIEIDSEEGPIIGSVLLKASVGIARLHTPRSLEALTLSGVVGQRISRTFPLRNAGNISLQVELKVQNDMEYFTVSPSRTVLRPQQEEEITVHFKPVKADCVIDSTLVMSVLPDGPVYDLLLRGMATSAEKDIPKKESELLLCNKPVVCWGSVAIGNAVQQKVILKHNGSPSSKPMRLQLSVQHPDFQLQNTFGKVDEKTMASIVNLTPQEELPVHILFAPSTLGLISGALLIRNNKTKSKVPLHGCGGSSELVLVDTRKLSEGYIANIGEVYLGKKNVVKVTVKNTGNRAAFVKAVCYSDISSQTVYPVSHLNIAPNNFVLPERTSKQVVIVYQPLESDALKCRNEISTVATVAFYTGDEGIRQQYKRYVQRHDIPYTSAQCKGPLANINFLTAFQDEDKVIEDAVYPQVPQWTQFFQSCVSRVLLMLVGSPPTIQDKDRSLDLVPMPGPTENGHVQLTSEPSDPTVNDPPTVTRKLAPVATQEEVESKKLESWTVLPEQLVLTTFKTLSEKGTGRIQIINFSERPLSFEFIWPAQYLAITPDSGQVPARSQVMVVMSPRPTLQSSGIGLPWGGTVYIQCDGIQKAVRVQIREEVVLENSPYQPGAVSLQALESKEGSATPFTPALPTSHLAPLVVKNKQLVFQDTPSGKESVLELVMENISHTNVMWDLSSVAPAYIKASDNSGDLYRATYTVFSFHKRSGVAASRSIIRIPVHFQPRDPGRYSQFWDLQFKQEESRRVHKQKIELTGQAIKKPSQSEGKSSSVFHSTKRQSKEPPTNLVESKDEWPPLTNSQDAVETVSSNSSTKLSTKPKGIYLTESTITFPPTIPGQSSFMKVKICNASAEGSTVKVVTPKGPFSVTHQDVTVKPRHYVRIPIKFVPIEPDTKYEAVALFTSKTGVTEQVTLYGSSTSKLS